MFSDVVEMQLNFLQGLPSHYPGVSARFIWCFCVIEVDLCCPIGYKYCINKGGNSYAAQEIRQVRP